MSVSTIKIVYACSFSLEGHSGHRRATRQKLEALALTADLRVVSGSQRGRVLRMLELPIIELKTAWLIMVWHPDIIVSRGYIGPAFQSLAALFKIPTVREIHANASEESTLLGARRVPRMLTKALNVISKLADRRATLRIFNNPALLKWFHETVVVGSRDVVVYNGCSHDCRSTLARDDARARLGLDQGCTYLVFTGSASEWHGVEYLVDLQALFNAEGDSIKIVCGGGAVAKNLDPYGLIQNITPLDEVGCADLIRAGNLCLLPVKNNRVSPGSPLKLYDYILNSAWVVTQENLDGYSDEVIKYQVGITTDFRNASRARREILRFLSSNGENEHPYPIVDVSWERRMAEWSAAFASIRSPLN